MTDLFRVQEDVAAQPSINPAQINCAARVYYYLSQTPLISRASLLYYGGWSEAQLLEALSFLERLGAEIIVEPNQCLYLRSSFDFHQALMHYFGIVNLYLTPYTSGPLMKAMEFLRKWFEADPRVLTVGETISLLKSEGFTEVLLTEDFMFNLMALLRKFGYHLQSGTNSASIDTLPVTRLRGRGVTLAAVYRLKRNGLNSLGQLISYLKIRNLGYLDSKLSRHEDAIRQGLAYYYPTESF